MRKIITLTFSCLSLIFCQAQLASWNTTCNGSNGTASSSTVSPSTMGVNASCQSSCFTGKGNIVGYDSANSGNDEFSFGYVATENTSISSINYGINRQGATFNEWRLFIQVGSSVVVDKVVSSSHSGTASFSESLNEMVDAGQTVSIYLYPENYQGSINCDNSVYFALESAEILGSLLPVELVDFSAATENNRVELTWITASEINNDYFEILKSVDGNSYSSIGRIEGNGTTKYESQYSFQLIQSEVQAYYKLKQYDFDGKYSFSPVTSVTIDKASHDGTIDDLRIDENRRIAWTSALPGSVEVFNTSGQKVQNYSWEESGRQYLQLNQLGNVRSKILILKFSDNSTHKLFVQ